MAVLAEGGGLRVGCGKLWDTRPNVPMRVEIGVFLRSVRAGIFLPKDFLLRF